MINISYVGKAKTLLSYIGLHDRNWNSESTELEHDIYVFNKEVSPYCSICEKISCGDGTLYPETCKMCTKKNKCFFHTDYNASVFDNYPPGVNSRDFD